MLKKSVGSLPTFHLWVLVSALPRGKINHLYKRGKDTVLKPVLIRVAMSFVGFADPLQVKIVPELSRTRWTSIWLYFSRCSWMQMLMELEEHLLKNNLADLVPQMKEFGLHLIQVILFLDSYSVCSCIMFSQDSTDFLVQFGIHVNLWYYFLFKYIKCHNSLL